jgi:1-acyl-sn-glycerol-3-phosphate acyltransferase
LPKRHYYILTMPVLYSAISVFTWYCCKLFFRDITVINEENVPREGPVIIYGNHNNQFVDGMVHSISLSC